MFREAVMAFMGVKSRTKPSIEDQYCEACKKAGKADCESCTREISVLK